MEALELYGKGGEYERAGRAGEAIPLDEHALDAGLPDEDHVRALELGSSFRSLGRIAESIALLGAARGPYPDVRRLRAFLALAPQSAGRSTEAPAERLDAIAGEGEDERSLRASASER